MKNTILALSLCTACGIVLAQPMEEKDVALQGLNAIKATTPNTQSVGPGAAQAGYMGAILEQLVLLNMTVQQMKPTTSFCSYENKNYSEGAVYNVGKITLVCVERDWGVQSIDWNGTKAARELLWEPITSKRLETYRKATGLSER